TALDHEQHLKGPDTPEAKAVLEKIDAIVGRLMAAEQKAHSNAVIALVSDHGFEPSRYALNLFRPFIDEGLIRLDRDGKIASWQAMPWISGGSAAIVLAKPDDHALVARVTTLLDRLAANPANGIARIADRHTIAQMSGNAQASFYLNLRPDFVTDIFRGADAAIVGPAPVKGMHGYFPGPSNLQSTFMLLGKGVPAGKDLGQVDMRAIAPTLAEILRVSLPDAEEQAVAWRP
ncbi:MAG TPA: alkaline phosphatase family protein, partial [Sphingobium sp.]|nr:alkaline phosphatase family protein [Sphingobium sp.]